MLRRIMTAVTLFVASMSAKPAVHSEEWGKTSDGIVRLYTISDSEMSVQLTNFGARIVSIMAPDRQGKIQDVVLGYHYFAQYLSHPKGYLGATVGRYANRIAGGEFTLNGVTYHVPTNNNGNALHGGTLGFSSKVWKAHIRGKQSVEFTLLSPDGDMGFPGDLTVHVRYTLEVNKLRIDYEATTTKPTVINLTNHSYFNLAGEGSGPILDQDLRINSSAFTPIDSKLIPTGDIHSVANTPFDFRKLTPIGERIQTNDQQLQYAGGYDQNFVLEGAEGNLKEAAFAVDPQSGRTLTVLTTQPGLQFYSGNSLDGSVTGYSGKPYNKYAGFCLETQHFPDSPNHPAFPETILRPGQKMRSTTVFTFGVDHHAAQ